MKLKYTIAVASALLAAALTSNAAQYAIFNYTNGPGTDTLFANSDNTLMDGTGIVTMGYFASGVTVADIDTIGELFALKGSFTSVQTAIPGTSEALTAPGFLAEDYTSSGGNITGSNALIGRMLYAIATDAESLSAATLTSGYALFTVGTIMDDIPSENAYVANPAGGATIIIGELDSGDFGDLGGLGEGTYTTLKLVSVPEPSAALLGAVGTLGLLRRRRI